MFRYILISIILVIEGGQETTNDNTAQQMGMCICKMSPKPEEVGTFTKTQILQHGYNVEQYCKKTILTIPRRNFPSNSITTLSLEYLRFLWTFRRFRNFKITVYFLKKYLL